MNDQENGNDQQAEAKPPVPGADDAATTESAELPESDYEFAEPQLDSAEISPDVAESVNLEEVAAEAAEVERQAEHSAELPASEVIASIPKTGIAFDAPATHGDWDVDESTVLRTDFTKPPVANNPWTPPATTAPGAVEPAAADTAEPASNAPVPPRPTAPPEQAPAAEATPAGSGPEAASSHIGRSVDDGSGWRRPETQWQPRANAWQSPGQVAQGVVDAAALAASQNSAQGEPAPGQPGATPVAPADAQPKPGNPAPYGTPGTPVPPPPYGAPVQAGPQPPYGAPTQHGAAQGGPAQANAGQGAVQPGVPPVPPVPGYPGQPGAPWQGGPQGPGFPGGPQGPGMPGGPQGPQGPGQGSPGNKNKLFIILGVAVVGVALIILLIWILVGLLGGGGKSDAGDTAKPTATSAASDNASTPASDAAGASGLIVEQAKPLEWLEADCLRGFTTVTKPADVVLCSTPHAAQVVGTFEYSMTDTFPGADTVKAKAADVCGAVSLTDAAKSYKGLKSFNVFPTSGSWDNGDRTIQCIIVDPSGDNLKESFIS
ncbi:septum formation family protein [Arthrobacter sp. GMC3]|uniref:septum formation family protein n=1 Tax=Arthrobacter sp. GMC3 TaxID=2058894 RepID=UPI000CE4F05C|nr:septum formation family protein [Arthrobacter sp. GMC3]